MLNKTIILLWNFFCNFQLEMIRRINCTSYEALKATVEVEKSYNGPIFILFKGSKNDKGVNWCSDCVKGRLVCFNFKLFSPNQYCEWLCMNDIFFFLAEPVIAEIVDSLSVDLLFIQCEVGDKEL